MKKKILISLVACFIAAGSFIGYNLTENTSRLDVSLSDISVMAQADGENNGPCTVYDFDDHILTLKTCFPLFWQQKLICDPMPDKCCKADSQQPCSGSGWPT